MVQTGHQNGSDHAHFFHPNRETAAAAGVFFFIQEKIFHSLFVLPKQHVGIKAALFQCFHGVEFSPEPVFIVKVRAVSRILEYGISVVQADADDHWHLSSSGLCHHDISKFPGILIGKMIKLQDLFLHLKHCDQFFYCHIHSSQMFLSSLILHFFCSGYKPEYSDLF